MIPFLIPLALKLSPVGRLVKAIPRPVWIAIGVALLLGALVWWHNDAVSDARKAGYAQGVTDEGARIAKKALTIKVKADAAAAKISKVLKEQNDVENRAIARRADDLRMRGPGKASCTGVAGLPRGAGGSVAAGGQADGAGTGLPVEDRIALPFGWAVDQAERCDLNRGEVLTWREWYRQQSEAWAKIGK